MHSIPVSRRKLLQGSALLAAAAFLTPGATLAAGASGAAPASGKASGNAQAPVVGSRNVTGTPHKGSAAKVYFSPVIDAASLIKLYTLVNENIYGKVAIKLHTGEPNGPNILPRDMVKAFQAQVPDSTIVETNTLYQGGRDTTAKHRETLKVNGWTFCPVDIMDEHGDVSLPVADGFHLKEVAMGKGIMDYDSMIVLTHFKGHAMGGFGGVLKNQSIGVASRDGKAYIHSAGKTSDPEILWDNIAEQDAFLESMAAAAQGVHDHFKGNILYINVMNNMSVDCDCSSHPSDPRLKDIGILASDDPVALDQACLSLVMEVQPAPGNDNQPLLERITTRHGTHTVDYAEKIGLGSRQYRLIDIDKNDK